MSFLVINCSPSSCQFLPLRLNNFITSCRTNFVEQSPSWVPNKSPASQEILRILWNRRFITAFKKSPPPVSVLSYIDPVHASNHFSKIHFNNIIRSTYGSSEWSPSLRFPHQILYAPLLFPIRATCHSHLIILDLITRIIFRKYYRP